jgi:hypothetical protein
LARTFRLKGKEYELSRADVERTAANLEPRPTEKYAVQIGGRYFPPKQLLAAVLRLAPSTYTTMDASRILARLGFEIISPETQSSYETSQRSPETSSSGSPSDWMEHSKDLLSYADTWDQQDNRVWRLQNWVRDARQEKRVRNLFEAYLFATGLGNFAVQREPKDRARPDFMLVSANKRIAVEVKELLPVDFEIASDVELYDPCRPIRERISQAEQQLSTVEDAVRCLLLYSRCTPWHIFDWRIIIGVLRGRSEAVQLGLELENPGDRAANHRPEILDAVIVLDQLRTGYLRFRAHIATQESKAKRMLTDAEFLSELQRARGTERDIMLSRLRVIVHENPNSQNRLPRELFRGPSDEWYSVQDDGQISRTFEGEEIQRLEKDGIYRPSCA